MAGPLFQHPLRDATAVALIWVSIHFSFDLFVLNVVIPNQFTTLGSTGIAGGLSLFVSVLYLHERTA